MKKVLVLLANGFEDIEAVTVIDLLRRAKINVTVTTVDNSPIISGSMLKYNVDKDISEIKAEDYDMLFLPGGGGVKELDNSLKVKEIITSFVRSKKFVAAICAAPLILGKMGFLDNKRFTCYPSFERFSDKGIYTGNGVEVDGNIITGRGIAYVFDFAFMLIKILEADDVLSSVKTSTLFNEGIHC